MSRWSAPELAALIAYRAEGHPASTIAAALSRRFGRPISRSAVLGACHRHNIPTPRKRRFDLAEDRAQDLRDLRALSGLVPLSAARLERLRPILAEDLAHPDPLDPDPLAAYFPLMVRLSARSAHA